MASNCHVGGPIMSNILFSVAIQSETMFIISENFTRSSDRGFNPLLGFVLLKRHLEFF